jgi:DNA polymerase-3 subunit epsilon
MREIVLDTETTGLDPESGHRVVEIGCIELVNHLPTGRDFHTYLNPERDMPPDAERIHGLSAAFLADKPRFAAQAEGFLAFIGDAPLIAHNAGFDMKFINAELARIDRPPIDNSRVIDTLTIARQRYPGAQHSLDALCRRFEIDLTERESKGHGALLDSHLLATVYLELIGGRQPGLDLAKGGAIVVDMAAPRTRREPRRGLPGAIPSEDEAAAHTAFLERIKDPIWRA